MEALLQYLLVQLPRRYVSCMKSSSQGENPTNIYERAVCIVNTRL